MEGVEFRLVRSKVSVEIVVAVTDGLSVRGYWNDVGLRAFSIENLRERDLLLDAMCVVKSRKGVQIWSALF